MDEFEKKQVLLVEDDARLRGTVREILRWQGYHVHEAADGAEALALVAAAQPDVIVTDLNMPVMDGGAFIQRCRAMPGLDQVPITVMSAAERDSLDGLTAAHVNAYLEAIRPCRSDDRDRRSGERIRRWAFTCACPRFRDPRLTVGNVYARVG